MPYVLAAILSSFGYAVGDSFNGLVAKKNSSVVVGFWASIFCVMLFFLPLVIFFRDQLARVTVVNLLIIAGLTCVISFGYLAFITGMRKGSVMLTGVIAGSFPAVTTLISLVVFKERVTVLQMVAIVTVLAGIVLSSLNITNRRFLHDLKSSALLYAFAAFLLWGIYFALVRIPIERIGWFAPQYIMDVFSIFFFFLLARGRAEREAVLRLPKLAWLLALVSLAQLGASMLYNYAISQGPTSIVAPIAGSSPAFFVILAFIIFKEKLGASQKFGIVVTVAGVIALSAFN